MPAGQIPAVCRGLERAQRIETATARAYWATFQREVHPDYESLAAWLCTAHVAPPNRPDQPISQPVHIGSAPTALVVILSHRRRVTATGAASAALCLTAWAWKSRAASRPDLKRIA